MIYTLKRRNRSKWSGVLAYNSTFISFQPAISKKTRRLNLGLTDSEIKEFEKKLHMKDGALTDMVDTKGVLLSDFWRDLNLDIPEDGQIFDTDNPMDDLLVKVLKASDLVANRGELSDKAQFELYNADEAAVKINKTRQARAQAFALYAQMSSVDKEEYAISKGNKVSNTSAAVIDNLVGNDVESNPDGFIAWVKNSNYKKIIRLYRFVSAGIIRRAGNKFFYNQIQIGVSEDSAVSYLETPSNQQVVTGIIQEYEEYKNLNSLQSPLDITEDNDILPNNVSNKNQSELDEDNIETIIKETDENKVAVDSDGLDIDDTNKDLEEA